MSFCIHTVPCSRCDHPINNSIFNYAYQRFGLPLCMDCQDGYRRLTYPPSPHAKDLYLALKQRQVAALLEEYDGHKRIDIVVKDALVHIEVDWDHHHTNSFQAFRDLLRTYYSVKNGYTTLRIPNKLIEEDVNETAWLIKKFLDENRKRAYSIY
jgi:very-short-patch-repair endonuclease